MSSPTTNAATTTTTLATMLATTLDRCQMPNSSSNTNYIKLLLDLIIRIAMGF
jgi:hypothetical protein